MKNPLPLLVVSLLIWVIGGSFLYNAICCGFPGPSLAIKDGDQTIAKSSQNIVFSIGGAKPEISDQVKEALSVASNYLNDAPQKVLLIDGEYLETETSVYNEELGLFRSRRVSEFLHTLGFDPQQVIARKGDNERVLTEEDKVYGGVSFRIAELPFYNLKIEDGQDFVSSAANNLRFKQSAFEFEPPSEDVDKVFKSTAEYLKKNAAKKLIITGLFRSDEENTSIVTDLGLARANQIKNIFQDLGVSSDQLTTLSKVNEELLFPANLVNGAAVYEFQERAITEESQAKEEEIVSQIEEELKKDDIKLYFERGKNSLALSQNQREFFANLIRYLDSKASARVYVEGHASSTGTRSSNLELSLERATFIKDYLVRNGLNSEQIITSGKGMAAPIATNDTEEGRAANRRVEVFIK